MSLGIAIESAARPLRRFFRNIGHRKTTYLGAAGILGVGIGMSVAIFSLVDAVLLRPLPFPDQTVGTALLEGRDFDEHDSEDGEPVVIISNALAKRIRSAGYSPVGHRLRLGLGPERWNKVIAVVEDARYRSITQANADLFVPYSQARQPTPYVLVRGSQPPKA